MTATTNTLSTLYQLLESTDTQYRVFDMGRRVQKIANADFKAFEDATQPYPYPLRQKAWLAILFWDKNRSSEHYLWFLSFQLDEQGMLIQATRNHFIAMVIEILGTQLTGNGVNQEKLDNNPYTFKPDQAKLAMLNALIKTQLKQNASVYYEHAQSYLSGDLGWDDWHSVGLQGLADFVARLDSDSNADSLLKALPNLPIDVATPLLGLLEHGHITTAICEQLVAQTQAAIENNDKQGLINGIRAISNAKAAALRQQVLTEVLNSDFAADPEILLVLTGRCWLDLEDDALRHQFLEALAAADPEGQLFQGIVGDLVAIPAIRHKMLTSFRSPDRSPTLAKAIGLLFGQHH